MPNTRGLYTESETESPERQRPGALRREVARNDMSSCPFRSSESQVCGYFSFLEARLTSGGRAASRRRVTQAVRSRVTTCRRPLLRRSAVRPIAQRTHAELELGKAGDLTIRALLFRCCVVLCSSTHDQNVLCSMKINWASSPRSRIRDGGSVTGNWDNWHNALHKCRLNAPHACHFSEFERKTRHHRPYFFRLMLGPRLTDQRDSRILVT